MRQCWIKHPEAEQPVIADVMFISAHPQTFFNVFWMKQHFCFIIFL